MAWFWKKKVEFSCFWGVWGLSGLRILLSYFWPAPLQRPKGGKIRKKKSTANGSKPPPNHVLSKSKLKKIIIFDRKKFGPKLPRNQLCRAMAPCSAGQRRSALVPSKYPTVSKKSKKNVPELHLAAIFCEKKSETVAKHRVTRSKLPFFGWQYPKWRGFGKKVELSCFLGFWGFPASEFC